MFRSYSSTHPIVVCILIGLALAGCATHTGVIPLGQTLEPLDEGTYYTQIKTKGAVDGRLTALDVKRCAWQQYCAQGCDDPLAIQAGTFAIGRQLVCTSELVAVPSPGLVNEIVTLGGGVVGSAVFGSVGAAVLRPPTYRNTETTQVNQQGARSQSTGGSSSSSAQGGNATAGASANANARTDPRITVNNSPNSNTFRVGSPQNTSTNNFNPVTNP